MISSRDSEIPSVAALNTDKPMIQESDIDTFPSQAPFAIMRSISRRLTNTLGPGKTKSASELRLQGLQLDPIKVHSDDDESSVKSSKVFSLRSSRSRGRKLERFGSGSSDTWEIGYNGGHIVVSPEGLTVIPRRGFPFLKELWWEPSLLHVDTLRQLGRGACSIVHPGKLIDEGFERPCAVKVFNLLDDQQQKQLIQEIRTLVRSTEEKCDALVKFLGAFQRPQGKVNVLLEYMDRGSLQDLISRERLRLTITASGDGGLFPERVVAAIAFQILQGLIHLHKINCIHRDIKPSNLLINSKGELKLTDFGILTELPSAISKMDGVVGTVKFMSPARLRGEEYGLEADIWSFGLVLLECASQLPFWDSLSQVEMLQLLEEQGSKGLISAGRGHLSRRFVDVITRVLHIDPSKRASAEEITRLPWFITQGVTTQRSATSVLSNYLLRTDILAEAFMAPKYATEQEEVSWLYGKGD